MQRRSVRAATAATAMTLAFTLAACSPDSPKVDGDEKKGSEPSKTLVPDKLSQTDADLSKYTSQKLSWSKDTCTQDVKELNTFSLRDLAPVNDRTECAVVTVPKDYSEPGKGDIKVMVTRTKAKDGGDARLLMTNPGGPGSPAGVFSVATAALSPMGLDHDVIGVDPRGTGGGTRVTCDLKSPDVDDRSDLSDANVKAMQAAARKTVDDCVDKHGDLLPYINTDNTARDHQLVMQLLGKKQTDYYGVSAGTWLGARFGTLFPKSVGRFVLDSATKYTASFQDSFGMQPMAFQRRFDDQLVPWLARQDAKYKLGSSDEDVKTSYEAIRTAAGKGELGKFDDPSLIDNIVAQTMYTDRGFTTAGALLNLLNAARNGDEKALTTAESALGGASASAKEDSKNQSTVFIATRCNDTTWSKDENSYVKTAKAEKEKYPLIGYSDAANECAYWPYQASDTKVDLSKTPKMMVVQTEADPATAYEGARDAHKEAGNSVMIAVDDQGNHGAVLGGGNLCVEQKSYAFLTKGELPEEDIVCPAIPLPNEQQVHSFGFKPEGKAVEMPEDPTPTWQKKLLEILGAILQEILTPKQTPQD